MARKADVGSAIKQRPPRPQGGKDLAQRLRAISHHHQKPGGDDRIHRRQRFAKGKNVRSDEMAVPQLANVGPVLSAGEQPLGEVYTGNLNVRVTLCEAASVEAGTAGYFQEVGFGAGLGAGPKCIRDCCGVIAKQMLTTECVEP